MLRVRQVKILVEEATRDRLVDKCAIKLGVARKMIQDVRVVKRSIDAREKPLIYYSYIVDVQLCDEEKVLYKNRGGDVIKSFDKGYEVEITGEVALTGKVVVVGSGPCGLFCAYMLAKYGYSPLVIERGEMVDKRIEDVLEFFETGNLLGHSNVQFGEGGAGTFSDGKLNTLVKDSASRQRLVFEILVECGAPGEILFESKPHIGTDLLRDVVRNMRNKIIAMGGVFRFRTCLTDIHIENGRLQSIVVNDSEEIQAEVLVLAIGHSARDTFEMLYDKGFHMESKPFAVGVRIQHPQDMINESQYGVKKHSILKNASYKLTYKAKSGRGVYTFCMCPGGYVVNASTFSGGVVVNGMSNYHRDSGNANSAVIVTVTKDDYGEGVLAGVRFQEKLERKAYELGGGLIPISLWKDYYSNSVSQGFGEVSPRFCGKYRFCNLNELFPDDINEALKDGIRYFDRKIKGFSRDDAIIAGVESRTSSPVRIVRDDRGEANYKGIYPSGEGAGYAGGITSSAIDGIVTFEKIVSLYKV